MEPGRGVKTLALYRTWFDIACLYLQREVRQTHVFHAARVTILPWKTTGNSVSTTTEKCKISANKYKHVQQNYQQRTLFPLAFPATINEAELPWRKSICCDKDHRSQTEMSDVRKATGWCPWLKDALLSAFSLALLTRKLAEQNHYAAVKPKAGNHSKKANCLIQYNQSVPGVNPTLVIPRFDEDRGCGVSLCQRSLDTMVPMTGLGYQDTLTPGRRGHQWILSHFLFYLSTMLLQSKKGSFFRINRPSLNLHAQLCLNTGLARTSWVKFSQDCGTSSG